MSIDWRRARSETYGCQEVVHFNNAGAALMPNCVVEAAINHIKDEARWGSYEAAERALERIERVYDAAAALFACDPREIAIVENASRAWGLVFYSLDFRPGDVVLTSKSEYANNYIAMLHVKKTADVHIAVLPDSEDGGISLPTLQWALDAFGKRIKVISLVHVPTNNGLVNAVAEIGRVVREAKVAGSLASNALYMLDACQSVGQIDINVAEIGCDVLTTCSRKYLRGPRGLGILFVRRGLLDPMRNEEPVLLDVRAAEWTARESYRVYGDGRRFETWETNNSSKIALGVAIEHARSWGIARIEAHVSAFAARLRQNLSQVKGVKVHDRGAKQCGIVSFTVGGSDPTKVKDFLSRCNINVSVSERALTRLDMEDRNLDAVVRASVHYYNSEDELDLFARKVDEFRLWQIRND